MFELEIHQSELDERSERVLVNSSLHIALAHLDAALFKTEFKINTRLAFHWKILF